MHVEIWSDIACPWCYVGKRRFETALDGFEHRDAVRLSWRSFELDPDAPSERDGDLATNLAAKYGMSRGQAVEMQKGMTEVGAGEGIDFRFDLARAGNTFDAHRLVHLAAEHGLGDTMNERLLAAYHGDGELISDHATLERLAEQVGLARSVVRDMWAGERYAAEVREDERTAAALGISAVPFFVVDRKVAVSGAQAPEILAKLLERGWADRAALAAAP